jgi:hypothetical protein
VSGSGDFVIEIWLQRIHFRPTIVKQYPIGSFYAFQEFMALTSR